MSVAIRSSNSGVCGDATGHHTAIYPATITAGDTLLWFVSCDANEITGPASGWTGDHVHVGTAASMCWGWKKAAGTETGAFNAAATSDNAEPAYFTIYAISGAADPTVTAPTFATAATGTDSTAELPSLTGLASKAYLFVAAWGNDHSDTVSGWPANYPDSHLDSRGTASGDAGQASATCNYTGTAAPTGTLTLSGDEDWMSQVVAIHPAVSPDATVTPAAAALTLWAPQATAREYMRHQEGSLTAGRQEGALSVDSEEGQRT